MKTTQTNPIPNDLMAELQAAAEQASQGVLDPKGREQACEEMDRLRQAIRGQHGILDIGVPAIR